MAGMVIIGAGECGVRAAFALREQGYEGTVTLLGAEECLPYERPPLSKSGEEALKPIRAAEAYEQAGIVLRLGQAVTSIDRGAKSVLLGNGDRLDYDRLLLATGAKARTFPGFETCLTLRSDRDAAAIRAALKPGARVGIVGGGFIGLEIAAMARAQGAEVALYELAPRLLARAVPAEIAVIVEAKHRAEGVDLHLSANVARADAQSVSLKDGTTQGFDIVIAGMGAEPKTALARDAGLEVTNGIAVNGTLQTSDSNIFAAGDCCNFDWRGARLRLESWKAAQDQGAHAAAAMLGSTAPYAKAPWFWSDQYDMTLQVAGIFEMARPVQTREAEVGRAIVFQCDASGALQAAAGIDTGQAVAKDIRILEKLIERGGPIDPDALSDPSQNLKRLLKAA